MESNLNQGPPRAGVWRNRFVRTDTYTQMCTIYYVPAACREQCTIDPSPIRVISKLSKKNLRAFKSQPRHRKLRDESPNSCPPCSSLAVSGAHYARFSLPILYSCISNLSSSFAVLCSTHLGVYCASTNDSSHYPATGFLSESSIHRPDYGTFCPLYALMTSSHA